MRWKMMKEDPGVSSAQAWVCPHAPQEIFKETQVSKLGDAPVHPLLYQQSSVCPFPCYIFITSYVMCYAWSVPLFTFFSFFQFCLLFITSRNLAFLVWERNTLHSTLEHNIGFHAYLFCVFFIFSQLLSCLARSFHALYF